MNDPRTDRILAATAARYPAAKLEFLPPIDDGSIQIPTLFILQDVDLSELRAMERFARELMFAAFPGEPVPFLVRGNTPQAHAEFLREMAAEGHQFSNA
jgi:hypothetical protein